MSSASHPCVRVERRSFSREISGSPGTTYYYSRGGQTCFFVRSEIANLGKSANITVRGRRTIHVPAKTSQADLPPRSIFFVVRWIPCQRLTALGFFNRFFIGDRVDKPRDFGGVTIDMAWREWKRTPFLVRFWRFMP